MSSAKAPDLQPTLIGETVFIRPIREDDWQDMFEAASDPLIWEVHPAKDRYKEAAFGEYFEGAIASSSAFTFLDKATGKTIGSSRYYGYDSELSEIEIGWTFLTCAHWGGDTNREIKTLMLTYAFKFVETVVFWVGEDNTRSWKAVEKIGGVLRDGCFTRKGISGPHVVFEIRKDDFQGTAN